MTLCCVALGLENSFEFSSIIRNIKALGPFYHTFLGIKRVKNAGFPSAPPAGFVESVQRCCKRVKIPYNKKYMPNRKERRPRPGAHRPTRLQRVLEITDVVTVHYFEYSSRYVFGGERHPFWEFLYVDKGEALVTADKETRRLRQGELIFHQPDEFHTVAADGVCAPIWRWCLFVCTSPAMAFFRKESAAGREPERNCCPASCGGAGGFLHASGRSRNREPFPVERRPIRR